MVNRAHDLLTKANAKQSLANATLLISGAYLLSKLLGVVRDRLLVAHFGVGPELSAYYAAFRLPEMLFTLLVSGAFAVSFIPVLTEYLQKDERDQAWRVTSTLLNLLVLGTAVGGVLIWIFADPLTTLISPGFDQYTHNLAVNITRIYSITPVFFAISSVLGSVQQSFNRFVIFAMASVMYNVGIIIGIVALTNQHGIYGPAWGVVLGVVLQAMLQWLGLYGLGFKYRPVLMLKLKGVGTTLKLMLPRSIDLGIDQFNYSVETIIGSTINPGAIAQFAIANNLRNVPLVLIGSSITTAVFPRLAARADTGQREELIKVYVQTARLILFLSIPSALFALVARGYIVRLLYGFGNVATANTLGWFSGTIVFTGLFMLVSRVYYAMQDTRTPLYVSLCTIPINIGLSIVFSRLYGVVGLAMSASLVAAVETISLGVILHLRYGNFGEREIFRGAWRMVVAGIIMAGVLYPLISQFIPLYASDIGFFTLLPKFLLILAVGAVAYLIPCNILRLNEAKHVASRTRAIMARSLNLT